MIKTKNMKMCGRRGRQEEKTDTQNTNPNDVRSWFKSDCLKTQSTLPRARESSAFVYTVQGPSWNSIPVQILLQAAASHWAQCRDAARHSNHPASHLQPSLTITYLKSQSHLNYRYYLQSAIHKPNETLLYSHTVIKHWKVNNHCKKLTVKFLLQTKNI